MKGKNVFSKQEAEQIERTRTQYETDRREAADRMSP